MSTAATTSAFAPPKPTRIPVSRARRARRPPGVSGISCSARASDQPANASTHVTSPAPMPTARSGDEQHHEHGEVAERSPRASATPSAAGSARRWHGGNGRGASAQLDRPRRGGARASTRLTTHAAQRLRSPRASASLQKTSASSTTATANTLAPTTATVVRRASSLLARARGAARRRRGAAGSRAGSRSPVSVTARATSPDPKPHCAGGRTSPPSPRSRRPARRR